MKIKKKMKAYIFKGCVNAKRFMFEIIANKIAARNSLAARRDGGREERERYRYDNTIIG